MISTMPVTSKRREKELFAKCYARIERAVAHCNQMSEIWNGIPAEELSSFEVIVSDDGRGSLWLHPKISAWPQEMELELGEYLYQLRAALDGAVYASAIEDSGSDPPPSPFSTEFPICKDRKDWNGQARKIAYLNQGRQRFIHLMQPFEEPVIEPQYRIANFNRSLRFLNDLARLDRHRRLHTFCNRVKRSEPQLRYPEGVRLKEINIAEQEDISGTPLATFTLEGWKRGMTLSANPDADLDLSLQQLEPATATNDTFTNRLDAMAIAVRTIVLALEADSWKNA
jgi:hypothetical protein